MSSIVIAGTKLDQYGQYVGGTGNITKNDDSSIICTAGASNSRAYLFKKFPIHFGETIILKVKAKALSPTLQNDTSPRCNIIWYRKNSRVMVIVQNGNFFNSDDFIEETLVLNVNQPVQEGDYIQVGFGCFASTTTDVLIQEASIQIINSAYPALRTTLQGLIKVNPSEENVLPILELNNNFLQVRNPKLEFLNNTTIQINSNNLINPAASKSGGIMNVQMIISPDTGNDYYRYMPIIGSQDRNNGTINIVLVDNVTNTLVDFLSIKNKELFIQFNYNNV